MKRSIRIFISSFLIAYCIDAGTAWAQQVTLEYEEEVPQAAYAARKLGEALAERGYEMRPGRTGSDFLVRLEVQATRLGKEAFTIQPEGKVISVCGGDYRGMIYGALALAETLKNRTSLEKVEAEEQRPYLEFRAIKFNLPWETYRPSSALDQHFETARDLDFWEAFLDMMVENRFNVLSLWNMHPYAFMIQPKNFPEASPWTEEEFKQWQHLYREIFRMAKERALDTYIVHWNIFVSQAFAEANGVARVNYYPHYFVPGDTSEIVRRYLRESVKQVLEEYPDLDGIGISHGEGMAGMTPLERQHWVDDVLIAGMLEADRPVKLIHRVPFSSGRSSDPGVSRNVEEVTRAAMERLEDRFEGPIWVEIKFNWSHGHSTPRLVKVHGGKLGDTYFKPVPTNYRITWQVRNEDFFALRWGVPGFIREHIRLNGGEDYVGGYFVGSETYIPALDYFTALDEPVDWTWAFERQWLFYKLWGRLLYDPATPDAVFQAEFHRRYGPGADPLLQACSLASSTQLRLASLYDATWDFTLYSEGFLALQGDSTKFISVDRLIGQPTMNPGYVSVGEYVETLLSGDSLGADRITPPVLADMLEHDNRKALHLVEGIDTGGNASLMYEVADVKTWADLGLYLAEKLRGAMALQTYRLSGGAENKQQAIDHLQRALGYWDEVIRITRPIYRDMRLTHYNHNFFDANDDNLFHWALLREEVARDVEIARMATRDCEKDVEDSRGNMVPWEKGAWETGRYRSVFLEAGYKQEEIDGKLAKAYHDVFEGPDRVYFEVGDSMAYVTDLKNHDARTEGLSYGMMVAVQLDKKEVFDRLWRWTRKYMQHQGGPRDGYFAWSVDPGTGKHNSEGAASDGELYFVTGLLFASNRWGNDTGTDYYAEARRILDAMWSKDGSEGIHNILNVEHKQISFVPESERYHLTDPSYYLPAFFEIWAEYARDGHEQFYRDCADTARAFLHRVCHPETGLNPDYSEYSGQPPPGIPWRAAFRYDSWRVPMNIAMDYSWFAKDIKWQKEYGKRIQDFLFCRGIDTFEDQFNVDGTLPGWILPAGGYRKLRHSLGLVATSAAASLMGTQAKSWKFIDAVWNASLEPYEDGYFDPYYDGLLYLFSLMHLSGKYRIILPDTDQIPK